MIIAVMRIGERTVGRSAEEGARAVALGLLSEADEAAERLVTGADAEALHDFRIAVRRLRSALRAFRPWLRTRVARRHARRLRRVARSTGPARDAEVQLAWLRSELAALASDRRRVGLERILERLEARARGGPDLARVAHRYRRAAKKLRRRLRRRPRTAKAEVAAGTFGGVLGALVADQVQALRERMAAIHGPSDQVAVHRARIEGKRLRYLLEPLRGHRHADATRAVERLKRLQDVLGELHDAHVLADELREALEETAAERARLLHAALFPDGARDAALRDRLRASPRPGLVALARRVRARRDALHATLAREWREEGLDALTGEVLELAASLEAHSPVGGSGGASPRLRGWRTSVPRTM